MCEQSQTLTTKYLAYVCAQTGPSTSPQASAEWADDVRRQERKRHSRAGLPFTGLSTAATNARASGKRTWAQTRSALGETHVVPFLVNHSDPGLGVFTAGAPAVTGDTILIFLCNCASVVRSTVTTSQAGSRSPMQDQRASCSPPTSCACVSVLSKSFLHNRKRSTVADRTGMAVNLGLTFSHHHPIRRLHHRQLVVTRLARIAGCACAGRSTWFVVVCAGAACDAD